MVLFLVAGCSRNGSGPGGGSGAGGATPTPEAEAGVATSTTTSTAPIGDMVVVGASDGVGFGADDPARDAWPQVLFRTAMPPDAKLVNLARAGAKVSDALDRMLPAASQLVKQSASAGRRDIVVVWLNVNDLLGRVSPAEYQQELMTLVSGLRDGGSARVLVANTPPLDQSPAYLACRQQTGECLISPRFTVPAPELVQLGVAAYNAAIDQVVAETGAELVDLHAAGLAARAAGKESAAYGPDGFHPSTDGHRAVAQAFAAVLHH